MYEHGLFDQKLFFFIIIDPGSVNDIYCERTDIFLLSNFLNIFFHIQNIKLELYSQVSCLFYWSLISY